MPWAPSGTGSTSSPSSSSARSLSSTWCWESFLGGCTICISQTLVVLFFKALIQNLLCELCPCTVKGVQYVVCCWDQFGTGRVPSSTLVPGQQRGKMKESLFRITQRSCEFKGLFKFMGYLCCPHWLLLCCAILLECHVTCSGHVTWQYSHWSYVKKILTFFKQIHFIMHFSLLYMCYFMGYIFL